MAKRKKQKEQKEQKVQKALPRNERAMRAAHKIITQVIWPANLQLEEAIDVVAFVAKALVLSNTEENDLEDRSGMIAEINSRVAEVLMDIDPFEACGHSCEACEHLWLVPPQGKITEPFGILWDGGYEESSVKCVLGAELDLIDKTGVLVVEGVEGVAIIVPDWDGEDTVTCANPECGEVHDMHLKVAEDLFQLTVSQRKQQLGAN